MASLLVLAPNNDPFNFGTAKHHEWAAWFAEIHGGDQVRHLRRLHYRALSFEGLARPDGQANYENTEQCWHQIQSAASYARALGYVSPELVEDRRNPPPIINFEAREPPEPGIDFVDQYGWVTDLPRLSARLDDIYLDLARPVVSGYEWQPGDEPVHVEVWAEKTTVNDILAPLCQRLNVNLVAGPGFQSITNSYRVTRRAPTDRPTRILYISDFDPAGLVMPRAVARQLEFYTLECSDIALRPLVLTAGQIDEYELPRVPIKDSDKRKANFEQQNGAGAVELDALEALHPGELARIVAEAIGELRDGSIRDALREARFEANAIAEDLWHVESSELRSELADVEAEVNAVLSRHRPQLDLLGEALESDLAPARARLVELQQRQWELIDIFDPQLPTRPLAIAPPEDSEDWLYHSRRHWLDQLASYKLWRSR